MSHFTTSLLTDYEDVPITPYTLQSTVTGQIPGQYTLKYPTVLASLSESANYTSSCATVFDAASLTVTFTVVDVMIECIFVFDVPVPNNRINYYYANVLFDDIFVAMSAIPPLYAVPVISLSLQPRT